MSEVVNERVHMQRRKGACLWRIPSHVTGFLTGVMWREVAFMIALEARSTVPVPGSYVFTRMGFLARVVWRKSALKTA